MKYKEPIEISVNVKLKPWITPNFVCYDNGLGTEGVSIPLSEVSVDILQKMCDQFRDEVMEKAGYGVKKR